MIEQERLFPLPLRAEGREPHPIEEAALNATEKATRYIFGEDFDEMGDPSAEIEPRHVTGIVQIVLGELASKDLLKIQEEKEK